MITGQTSEGLIIEQPPIDTPNNLISYLVRMFTLVDNVFKNAGKLPIRKLLPSKPVVGKMYYFGIAVEGSVDITQEGLYIYTSTGWRYL